MQAQRLLIATAILTLGACNLWEPKVVCSDGTRCPDGTTCAAAQDICITGPCGNGVKEEGERCDDGNRKSDDGCSDDCTSLEICGDGVKEERLLEVCDDGNIKSGDRCSSDCRSDEECGNGIIDDQTGEVCDDGNTSALDGCRSDCMSLERCGDGITDESIGEKCDDGNLVSVDGCSSDCRSDEKCGNGTLDSQTGEVCDDGNTSEDDSCSSDCMNGCDDGVIRDAEECEPLQGLSYPGQMSCTEYDSFDMGRLGCDINCEHIKDRCVSFGLDFISPRMDLEESDVQMNGIWSDRNGSGYAVGNDGTIIAFDYIQWTRDGSLGDFSNTDFHGIWGSESGRVYVVGDSATILTRSGTVWESMMPPGSMAEAGPPPRLKGVWGYTVGEATTVFAVGDDCTILRLDGGPWVSENGPDGCDATSDLQAVSGNGSDRIYAVGSSRTLLRRDAGTWMQPQLNGVAAPSFDDIWVGADDSIFLAAGDHIYKCEDEDKDFDPDTGGLQCDDMRYPGDAPVRIWGSSPHDLFAVAGGTVFHSNGFLEDKWIAQFDTKQVGLGDIHGSSAFDIFVASKRGVLYGILPWRKMDSVYSDLLSVWADGTMTYAAGRAGVFKLDDNDAWQAVLSGRGEINGLWGTGTSHVFAVGHEYDSDQQRTLGRLFLFDGDELVGDTPEEWEVPPGTSPYLRSVWASDEDNVFVVGDDGVALLRAANGDWEQIDGTVSSIDLHDIWGSDMENLFAVGSASTILHYVDGDWVSEYIPFIDDETTLFAIWGTSAENIFAVGQNGTILHYKIVEGSVEKNWELMDSPTSATLYDIGGIVENGQTKLFAVGYGGLVLYYDGEVWSEVRTSTTDDFDGIWVTPTDAFMVADDGNTYRLRHSDIAAVSVE